MNENLAEERTDEVKPVLNIDAKATEHILHLNGIGKMKHIDVAHHAAGRRPYSKGLQHSSSNRSSRISSQEKKSGSRSSEATDITTEAATPELCSDEQASWQR